MPQIHSDVAIIGGGFGGVAAAIALVERGYRVALTEEFPWIGGQVTSQGLCVLDDMLCNETVGVSRRYFEFRNRTREWYRSHYTLSSLGAMQMHLCAGNARCSNLTAEPNVAHACLMDWLKPAVDAGKLQVFTGVVPVSAQRSGEVVKSVTCRAPVGTGEPITLSAAFFLDGTETGDTYPLLNIPYRLGSESKEVFGEAHAADRTQRTAVQCFTYCAMMEHVPGGNFVGEKPADYERIRDKSGFYLSSAGASPKEPAYMFKPRILASGARIVPFWHYRCVVDAQNFQGVTGRAVINVKSNDFNDAAHVENPDAVNVLARARQLTRAYLYWLQTEAPRDEGGFGYPELRPMSEATGTDDGIAQAPYVREGRRLVARRTITENDLHPAACPGANRGTHFIDGVGLGGYAIDIHARSGVAGPSVWEPARPYQVSLAAMLSPDLTNFAAAGKCIGVSQVANGSYRMHPSEWAIGEAAGELAAFCLANKLAPPLAHDALFDYQRQLIRTGIPVYWYEDMPFDHPAFEASQLLAITQIWPGAADHLRFDPYQSLGQHRLAFEAVMKKLGAAGMAVDALREACLTTHNARKYDVGHRVMCLLDEQGWIYDHPERAAK